MRGRETREGCEGKGDQGRIWGEGSRGGYEGEGDQGKDVRGRGTRGRYTSVGTSQAQGFLILGLQASLGCSQRTLPW